MGMLVPPAIFMIVIGEVTNASVVALFLAGFIPAAVIGVCLCVLVCVQAHLLGWPKDTRPSLAASSCALGATRAVPMVIPLVILGGFYLGAFTATEAGAVVALYSLLAARSITATSSWREMRIAYDSAMLTAAVVFLLAVATIFQYLMGVSGVPLLARRAAEAARRRRTGCSSRRRADDDGVRHGARRAAGGGRADPGGVPDRHAASASTRSISTSYRPRRSASACSCRRWGSGC